jgi:hypothetical protein
VLYVSGDHGMGAGPALLEAVVDPEQSVALWVADPNPRAQAFYRKHGFVADRAAQVEDGMREIPHGPRHAAQSVIQAWAGSRLAQSPGCASAAGRAVGDVVAPVACSKPGPACGFAGTDTDGGRPGRVGPFHAIEYACATSAHG